VKISGLRSYDLGRIQVIHERDYPNEIMPNLPQYKKAWVIESDAGNIVVVGGIRLIPEATLITNKSYSPLIRGKALLELFGLMEASCHLAEQDSLYAFVSKINDNETWTKALEHNGFVKMNDVPFVRDFNGTK